MKIKTAELTGKPLDWALAQACGHVVDISYGGGVCIQGLMGWQNFEGHADPATCMKLIKKYSANVDHTEHAPQIEVSIWYEVDYSDDSDRMTDADFDCQCVVGDTVEQAVARCVVAMRLGDEVDVPDELCGVSV
jgi:hypothetical protein